MTTQNLGGRKICWKGGVTGFSSRPDVLESPPTLRFWMDRWSRDQPQPGSLFQRLREAEKRDPGNEAGQTRPYKNSISIFYFLKSRIKFTLHNLVEGECPDQCSSLLPRCTRCKESQVVQTLMLCHNMCFEQAVLVSPRGEHGPKGLFRKSSETFLECQTSQHTHTSKDHLFKISGWYFDNCHLGQKSSRDFRETSHRTELFEAGLALSPIKRHGNLWVLIPLNLGLELLRTTRPRTIAL